MRKTIVTLLAATAAMLMLALATSTASALRSLSVSGGPNVQASGHLTFFNEEGKNAERSFWCDVTLLKTISSVIPKINGTLIGAVEGVAIDLASCQHGAGIRTVEDIRALRQSTERLETNSECRTTGTVILCIVNWRLFYEGFEGALPEISAIRLRVERTQFKIAFTATLFGVREKCLYRGDQTARVNVERRRITRGTLPAVARALSLFRTLEGLCPREPVLEGNFNVAPALTIALL